MDDKNDDDDGGMVCDDELNGGTIPDTERGTNAFKCNMISKGMENGAGKVVGGARRLVMGKGMTRNAMEMMMTRKVPEKTIEKPIKKRSRGAKSKIQKGKLMGTDSSQQGIGKFFFKINGNTKGDSLGSFKLT